jgi:hypothetical protein
MTISYLYLPWLSKIMKALTWFNWTLWSFNLACGRVLGRYADTSHVLLLLSQDLKDFGREAGNVSFADIDRDVPGQGYIASLWCCSRR